MQVVRLFVPAAALFFALCRQTRVESKQNTDGKPRDSHALAKAAAKQRRHALYIRSKWPQLFEDGRKGEAGSGFDTWVAGTSVIWSEDDEAVISAIKRAISRNFLPPYCDIFYAILESPEANIGSMSISEAVYRFTKNMHRKGRAGTGAGIAWRELVDPNIPACPLEG